MNLILLFKQDFIDEKIVKITGRRFNHIKNIHKACVGDILKIGLINDKIGTGEIIKISLSEIKIETNLNKNPPVPISATLVLALQRPKMLKRILQTVTSLGIKKVYLINTWKVEKSFWKTKILEQKNLNKQLILGLEQAKDTIMPRIFLKRFFNPFVKNELFEISKNKLKFLIHPKTKNLYPKSINKDAVVVIGPEGGFIDIEIKTLEKIGFKTVSLENEF